MTGRGNTGPGRSESDTDAGWGPKNRHPYEPKRPGGPQWPTSTEGGGEDELEEGE